MMSDDKDIMVLADTEIDIDADILHNYKKILKLCSPISNKITDIAYNKNDDKNIIPLNAKRKIALQITFDDDNNCPQNITIFDKAVLNAVCTIAWYDQSKFTAGQIYHLISGNKSRMGLLKNKNELKSIIQQILLSMDKLRKTWLQVSRPLSRDETVKWQQFTKDRQNSLFSVGMVDDASNNNEYSTGANMLEYRSTTIKCGGKMVNGYELLKRPYLLEEALIKNQINAISIEINKLPCATSWRSIIIRDYLISRIEALKNPRNNQYQQTILCDRLYEAIDNNNNYFDNLASDSSRAVMRKQIRDIAIRILKNWINLGYINNFEQFKDGRSIAGYKLIFNDKNQLIIDSKKNRLLAKKLYVKK
jgi:hypothetical protein